MTPALSSDIVLNYIYQYGVVNNFVHLFMMFVLLLTLFYVIYKYKKIFTPTEKMFLCSLIILGTLHHIMRLILLLKK